MSRNDAARYKITEKDLVTVSSATGSIKLKAKVTPRMPEGLVYIPYHFSETPVNAIWNGSAVTVVSIAK